MPQYTISLHPWRYKNLHEPVNVTVNGGLATSIKQTIFHVVVMGTPVPDLLKNRVYFIPSPWSC
jgi:hypothetical protein